MPSTMKSPPSRAVVLTAAALLTTLVPAGCDRGVVKPNAPPPPQVTVGRPVEKEVTDYEEFVGQTTAQYTVEVRARVSGYLDKINFKDGDEVAENAVLFEIDPRQYDAEVARTEASLAQAEAHASRLTKDYTRAKSLTGREVLSRQEYDAVTGDFSEAQAAVGIAKASRDTARLNQSWTKVVAPIAGRLSRRMVDRGNLVKADETLLTTIVSLDPIYVYFDVDERTLLKIRRLIAEGKIQGRSSTNRLPVDVALADEGEAFPHRGFINFSENRLDQMTGTLRVRAEIPNPRSESFSTRTDPSAPAPRLLSPGFFMRVRLPVGVAHKALLVPEQALGTDQGNKFLYVVTGKDVPIKDPKTGKDTGKTRHAENVVEYRQVSVGALHDGLRVIEGKLKPGERFVMTGLQRVRPGLEVQVKDEKPAPDKVANEAKPVVVKPPLGG